MLDYTKKKIEEDVAFGVKYDGGKKFSSEHGVICPHCHEGCEPEWEYTESYIDEWGEWECPSCEKTHQLIVEVDYRYITTL